MMYKKIISALIFVLVVAFGVVDKHVLHTASNKKIKYNPALLQVSTTSSSLNPVVRVIDGDTIVVLINGIEEKVRLLGINTPETVDPRKVVQCFGKEASDETKMLLEGIEVVTTPDTSQTNRDKYNRLLRYVYTEKGIFINKFLIEKGFAYEYPYHVPYVYQKEFKQAENDARNNERGLWAKTACKQFTQ